ncbi:MAG: hypothetical protein M1550_05805 [Deltaproteobacteria bacterium]|nr:hypothetical protein [Deltaproteobacteria bacterium]
MKKIMAIIVVAGLLATLAPAGAYAGDREWATAGKILTGIIGLSILGNALAYPAPVYAPPPRVYYAPPEQVWVPGHYVTRFQRHWVPGHWEYGRYEDEDDDDYGGGRVWISGHYVANEVQVWIPGHWEG